MTRKLIIGITGLILFIGVAYAAEKALVTAERAEAGKEKAEAAKPEQPVTSKVEGAKVSPVQKQKEGLIDQLIKAYKADDKKAMGEIIAKLEKRQKQMKKFAQFERWHQMAHRRMSQHRGWGFQQGPNRGGCWGCPGMQINRNWGPPCDGFRPMPQWKHPGGFGPMPQWKGCPQQPNQPISPTAEKPGAMWNNDDQSPESEGLSALDDQALFEEPDIELALDNDNPIDSEW